MVRKFSLKMRIESGNNLIVGEETQKGNIAVESDSAF